MEFIENKKYGNLFGIYKIEHIESGKAYIGQTRVRFIERYWLHVWKLNDQSHDNSYLQRAWNKYGADAFIFSVVEICDSESVLNDLEVSYIVSARESPSGCYNMSDGGDGKRGCAMPESARKTVGEKNRAHNIGRKASLETKRKMTEQRTGKPLPKNRSNVDPDLVRRAKELILSGVSSTRAAKECNISYGVVNGLLCRHTWRDIVVDGWEEFLSNRKTYTRQPRNKE